MSISLTHNQPALPKDRIIEFALLDLVTCFLCKEVLWLPVTCQNCEISFCSSCIKTWKLEAAEPTHCPSCFKEYIQRKCPTPTSHILSKLQVICRNKAHGCPEILPYNSLETHEELCDYQLKTCSGCRKEIIKMEFQQHYSRCPLVLLTCSECSSVHQRQNMDEHTETRCLRVQLDKFKNQLIGHQQTQNEKMVQIENQMSDLNETIQQLLQK